MTANEIAVHLIDRCDALSSFASYMFGSSLHGVGKDIDILIVGPSGEKLSHLKLQLAEVGRDLPLDILIMRPSEAQETGFVVREGCVTLSDLAFSQH